MDNISDISSQSSKSAAHRKVRMAYTLDGEQPVLCTLVSEQPYFYIEEDLPEEEDSLFDYSADEDFAALERDIAAMKRKMDVYDRLAGEFERSEDKLMQDFMTDGALISGKNSVPEDIDTDSFETMMEVLLSSRTAAEMTALCEKNAVIIRASRAVKDAEYLRDSQAILINPDMEEADQILCAARELRRHWQHRQGVLLHPLTFQPDEAVVVNRSQQADQAAFMMRVAWDLYLAGHKHVWARVENSQMADLGRAFAREAFTDFRTLNSGQAAGAVFETWFLSERCRFADKELIQSMLADYQGMVFENDQMSRSLSIDLISRLGEQPFGKNYLASYAQMILSDPIFTDVRDRANANFLWFIKFERSFRESEQGLHSSEDIHSPAFEEGLFSDIQEDVENEGLFAKTRASRGRNAGDGANADLESLQDGSNIIYIHFAGLREEREGRTNS